MYLCEPTKPFNLLQHTGSIISFLCVLVLLLNSITKTIFLTLYAKLLRHGHVRWFFVLTSPMIMMATPLLWYVKSIYVYNILYILPLLIYCNPRGAEGGGEEALKVNDLPDVWPLRVCILQFTKCTVRVRFHLHACMISILLTLQTNID